MTTKAKHLSVEALEARTRWAERKAALSEETHWTSKKNRCPSGKRGFDCPDDIWQLMRSERTITETDFVAYIGKCGQCGRCHRDKDQSGHKENDAHVLNGGGRHQTWYRPDEINTRAAERADMPQASLAIIPKNQGEVSSPSPAEMTDEALVS